MKKLSKGKLVAAILFMCFTLNTIIYFYLNGSPYAKDPFQSGLWCAFTGLSLAFVAFFVIIGVISYIIDNW